MDQQEIAIGAVSYAVQRVYHGTHAVSELVLEQIMRRGPEASFDGPRTDAV